MKIFFKIQNTVSPKIFLQLIFLLLLLFINSTLEVIGIGIIIPIYRIIVDHEKFFNDYLYDYDILIFLKNYSKNEILILVFSVFFIIIFLKYLIFILSNKYAINFTAVLKSKIITGIFKYYTIQPYIFFKNKNSSIIIRDLLREITEFCDRFVLSSIFCLLEIFILLFVILFLFYAESELTIYFILYSLIWSFIFFIFIKKKLNKAGKIRSQIDVKKFAILQEFIKNIKSIKISNQEDFFFNKFKNYIDNFEKSFAQFNFIQIISRPFLEFVGISFIVGWVIIQLNSNKELSDLFLSLSLLTLICIRILPSINKIIFSLGQIKFSLPSYKIVFDELNKLDNEKNIKNHKKLINFNNSIMLNQVSFNYDGKSKILNNVDLKINCGEKICVAGESGSGKTTLVEIIVGLVKPTNGNIIIDEKHEFLFNQNFFNAMYVPQDLLLFDGSIADNICLGEGEINKENLEKSIKLANLEKFISHLTKKENSSVGELGNKLSGGEKQRIGIARCFYKNPDLIILDEAMNAIDPFSRELVMKNIFSFFSNKTIIFISHDKEFIKNFKKIFVIRDGEVFLKN